MQPTARARYRARQFFGALRPRIDHARRDEALARLSDGERALFASMTPRDQQHCLDVFERLRAQGHDDADLLSAALLHDAGKGRIALWHRVAFVVVDASAPALLRRVVREGDGGSWRETLYRCVHHNEIGARQARGAGSSERVVALIRGDKNAALREPLAALAAADDAS